MRLRLKCPLALSAASPLHTSNTLTPAPSMNNTQVSSDLGFNLLEAIYSDGSAGTSLPNSSCTTICALRPLWTLVQAGCLRHTQSLRHKACKRLLETAWDNGDLEFRQFQGWDVLVGKCLAPASFKQFCFRLLLSRTLCPRLKRNRTLRDRKLNFNSLPFLCDCHLLSVPIYFLPDSLWMDLSQLLSWNQSLVIPRGGIYLV